MIKKGEDYFPVKTPAVAEYRAWGPNYFTSERIHLKHTGLEVERSPKWEYIVIEDGPRDRIVVCKFSCKYVKHLWRYAGWIRLNYRTFVGPIEALQYAQSIDRKASDTSLFIDRCQDQTLGRERIRSKPDSRARAS